MATISDYIGKSARANVKQAFERARQHESHHAFLTYTEARALERADKVDAGEIRGPLAGVPFVVKDNYLTFGAPTTAASKILEPFQAPLQATVIERLEAAGAICIG
ncbi:TPA: Asp-tRNA(Asn)/Glu-tRNA(Gln) amidotransferase GatCAB subunit A, partial [Candidatus Saccharibacteria bacterium]|nr:Asp-tRNA(Asn)/Glu-tRNA(Gln) amidotransferase GatCAB subunit A [Candidatus Saccharibacteria bacterium]